MELEKKMDAPPDQEISYGDQIKKRNDEKGCLDALLFTQCCGFCLCEGCSESSCEGCSESSCEGCSECLCGVCSETLGSCC